MVLGGIAGPNQKAAMRDDREFVHDPKRQGFYKKNPAYTGSTWEIFKEYPATALRDLGSAVKKGDQITVVRTPANDVYVTEGPMGVLYVTSSDLEGTEYERN